MAGTPPAAAPATTGAATTRPPLLVYADATGLWAADAGGPARALVQGTALFDPLISPDQTAVLYFHAVTPESRELWTVRTSGGNAHRLIAEDDLPQEGLPQGYTRRRIDSVQWIPGKQQLALTTVGVYGGQGPAPRLVSELWAVDANTGGLQPVLAQGALGGFAVSPDGARIAITRLDNNKDTLVVVNTDGSDARPLLEFPFVSGGGEAAFWPRPIWVTGNELLLAVPGPAAAFVPTETTALYRLRLDGSAQKLSEIRPLGLSNVLWSPDRRHLAYTRLPSPPQGATTYELVLANGDGSNEQVYATVRSGQVLSWAPDSTHFAYASEGRLYVGTLGGAPLPLTEAGSGTPGRAQWLAPQQVAYVLTSPGTAGSTSQLMLHTLGAPAQRAAQIQNPLPLVPEITFDVAPATGNGR